MNQSEDFGKILKLWPNLVDHYKLKVHYEQVMANQKALFNLMAERCHEQRQYVKVLQADYGFQTKYTANYEYLSILEKVIVQIGEYAEKC